VNSDNVSGCSAYRLSMLFLDVWSTSNPSRYASGRTSSAESWRAVWVPHFSAS
jgi:hypothetical protein